MCNVKTLHDGRQVASDSEEWRHEAEAITLLRMPLNQRKAHLAAVEARRKGDARQRLESTLMALWINQQAERLAGMDEYEQMQRLQALGRDNKEHIMRRIEAQLAVVLERRGDAANDNNEVNSQTERAV